MATRKQGISEVSDTKTGKAGKPARTGTKAASARGSAALAAELASLIPELDDEGLAFLIEQARVHLYNMKVEELEAAARAAEAASARSAKAGKRTVGTASAKASGAGRDGEFRIEAASDGSAYDLVYDGKWKMFSSEEMLAMVRIASVKDPVADVGARLYRWLLAERRDAINDLGLAGLADPRLKALVGLLRKTFTIKDGR